MMKLLRTNHLLCLLMLLVSNGIQAQKSAKILQKKSDLISFVVDTDLSAPSDHLDTNDAEGVTSTILYSALGIQDGRNANVIKRSFEDQELALSASDVFFKMMVRAYAEHRPIELSPDDVWLLISQGVAHHINQNAYTLRNRLVSHQGKMELTVKIDQTLLGKDDVMVTPWQDRPVDWPSIFDGFAAQLKANTKGDIAQVLEADFSTTTLESRIASQITLMNAMQPFFDYRVVRMACGTPYVILRGTPKDWQKMVDNVKKLEQYDLGWWTEKLIPVLEQFVQTSKGKVDLQFWRCMMAQIAPDKVRKGGCGMESPTKFDGWFLTFFPYDKAGRTPKEVSQDHRMLNEVAYADFRYVVENEVGDVVAEFPMQFWAGFVGVEEDLETFVLKPHIGWFVRRNTRQESVY